MDGPSFDELRPVETLLEFSSPAISDDVVGVD